jgi:hypothetical protein
MLEYTRAGGGDVVVVVALDRLGRSLSGIIRTIETITEAAVSELPGVPRRALVHRSKSSAAAQQNLRCSARRPFNGPRCGCRSAAY